MSHEPYRQGERIPQFVRNFENQALREIAGVYGIGDPRGEITRDAVLGVAGENAGPLLEAYIGQYVQRRLDPRTGLPNRLAWDERINDLSGGQEADDEMIGLLSIDIDHFKRVNDQLSYSAGDRLLEGVAARLRDTDIVYRLGGDEFGAIVADEAPRKVDALRDKEERLARIATRLRNDIVSEVFVGEFAGLGLDISIGGAARNGAETPQELIIIANTALKAAKEQHQAEARHGKPWRVRVAAQIGHMLLTYAGDYDERIHG